MKRLLRFVLGLTLLASILGCEATPYQKLGTTSSGGYYDRRISDDTFYVRFTANSNTAAKVVHRYLYRRAAEVTIENGFIYFAVIRGPDRLTGHMEFYPSEDYIKDMEPPVEVNIPLSNRLKITIQCFENVPEGIEMHLIDAREYLKYEESKDTKVEQSRHPTFLVGRDDRD